jgi:glycosyltransferase involved in cell wall biosynthesis
LVLAVARLVEKKGLDDLVRACRTLRDRGRVFRCRIIGTGDLRERLERLICGLGLEKVVSLEGEADHDEVRFWYRQAKVLVSPSLVTRDGDRDGIPNVLVEAAASGLPVVSTTVSGIPELVKQGKTGLLVPPRAPSELADAIDALLRAPLLREGLRINARTLVEEEFNLRRNALKIGEELRRVMVVASPAPAPEQMAIGLAR